MHALCFFDRLSRWAFAFSVLTSATLFGQSRIMSVHSVIAKDYQRQVGENGVPKRERYAIADGGYIGGTTRDNTMVRVPFSELAGVIAEYLGRQNYFLAKDRASADLLLVVHWGRTIAFDRTSTGLAMNELSQAYADLNIASADAAPPDSISYAGNPTTAQDEAFESAMMKILMFNRFRDKVNERNAVLLGYVDDVNRFDGIQRYAGNASAFDELIDDLEESRYYVTITAYDFDAMVERNERKVRWVTRVSMRAPGHAFHENLPVMLASASRYFGKNTGRLIRGHKAEVEIGEARVVSLVPESAVQRR